MTYRTELLHLIRTRIYMHPSCLSPKAAPPGFIRPLSSPSGKTTHGGDIRAQEVCKVVRYKEYQEEVRGEGPARSNAGRQGIEGGIGRGIGTNAGRN